MGTAEQLEALARLDELFRGAQRDYWIFGGWAVDLHAGRVTREHDDIDLAAWLMDQEPIDALLTGGGWTCTGAHPDDGYVVYERAGVRLELAWLAADPDGTIYTPAGDDRGTWPAGAFGADVGAVDGVRVRVVSLAALAEDKSQGYGDARAMAKDRADVDVINALVRGQ